VTAIPRGITRLETLLLTVAMAGLGALAVLVVVRPSLFDLSGALSGENAGRLAAGIVVYSLSHVLRVLRLALLLRDPGLRLRRVLQVHVMTAGLSLVLPFKLGEAVRVREVGVVAGSLRTGLLAVWLERTLDAAVLAVLVAVSAVAFPSSLDLLTPFLVLMSAFVAVTLVLITVVPENIRALMLHLVRRPFGERSVTALRLLRATLSTLEQAPSLLRGRAMTLLVLSALIWAAEIAVVSLTVPAAGAALSELSTSLLALLSGVSSGATPLMSSAADGLEDALRAFGQTPDVAAYRLCIVLPLLVGAPAAAAAYLRWRSEHA